MKTDGIRPAKSFARGVGAMCLTRTIDCIDFTQLTPQQKSELERLKQRLEKRKEALEEELAHLDEGLEKLVEKLS
jgi:hypothetical protein